jgi:thioredoxin-dependent peroxiredoxin
VQAYRDQYAQVTAKGAQVVGISVDDVETLKRFREANRLPFPLLSDEGGKVAKQYGGTVPVVGVANRATFVLDRDGTVSEIVTGSEAVNPASAIAACPIPKKEVAP